MAVPVRYTAVVNQAAAVFILMSLIGRDGVVLNLKEMLIDYLQAWNAHDQERLLRFYHPEYEGVDVGQARPIHGQEGAGG